MYDNTPSIIRWHLEESIDAHETCGVKYFHRMDNRLQTPHQSGLVRSRADSKSVYARPDNDSVAQLLPTWCHVSSSCRPRADIDI